METIATDRNGKVWTLTRECTPYQRAVFGKVLAAVHGVFRREQVSLSYFADDNNDRFFDTVEAALLSAIAEPQRPKGAEPQQPVRAKKSTEGYRPTYWWEND